MFKIDEIRNKILQGDVLEVLRKIPADSIDCIITSCPYWSLRSYLPNNHLDKSKEIGIEKTLSKYLDKMIGVLKELKRVMKPTATIFWNHGDSYASNGSQRFDRYKYGGKSGIHCGRARTNEIPAKSLCFQNFRLMIRACDELGFMVRDCLIWSKKVWLAKDNTTIGNAMPSSTRDRCTFTYEPVFMLTKSKKYWFDLDCLRVPHIWADRDKRSLLGRVEHKTGKTKIDAFQGGFNGVGYHPLGANRPNVWCIFTEPFSGAHFATFPTKLITDLIRASCPQWVCKCCGLPIIKSKKELKNISWTFCNCKILTCNKCGFVIELGHGTKANNKKVQAVQPRVQRKRQVETNKDKNLLWEEMLGDLDCSTSSNNKGMDNGAWIQNNTDAQSSFGNKRGLYNGTPFSNGENIGEMFDFGRSCASLERNKNRQSSRKFNNPKEKRTRQKNKQREKTSSNNLSSLRETNDAIQYCPQCKTPLKEKNKWQPGLVLDCFLGSGTTAVVAKKLGRDFIGIEINQDYVKMAEKRLSETHYNFELFND